MHALSADPLGSHTLLALPSGVFYVNAQWKKARSLDKLKGVVVTSVGWPPSVSRRSTG